MGGGGDVLLLFTMCCNCGDIELLPMHPHWSNLPTSSRKQHCKLINSIKTFVDAMQLPGSHHLGLRWTMVQRWERTPNISGPQALSPVQFPLSGLYSF
ncbi:hypothetical protein BDM02DRAFT_1760158 [Thelephora ganbajun]|uniref:Uncharacterized protein n=1 Tax=Thelephora ganbajun TaxID=370292 RepID=A0ACB6Z0W3_THEGA|nr:hypothetical protein BDM02DRAFT_1760158 [Thelephora ganbajun]